MNMRIFFNRSTLAALIFCPLFLFSMTSVEFRKPSLFNAAEYQLTPQFFKFISSGFWPATADLLWMNTLQIISTANYSHDTLAETLGFYRLITSLDPNFYEVYDQGAVVFGFFYEAAYPAIEIINRGIEVHEHGSPPRAFWTHPYSLYLYRAYVNAFLRNNWVDAKRDYLKVASMPNSPLYLQNMKTWLSKEGSEKKLAVRVLTILISITKDDAIRAKYQEKLKKYE